MRGAVPSIPHTTSWHVQLTTGAALPVIDEFPYTSISPMIPLLILA